MPAKWYKNKVLRKMREGSGAGVREAAKAVFAESQRRVPRDTGQLAETGRVDVDEENRRAVITYGTGLPDPRAAIVHEKLEIHHDVGDPKYLEAPLRELSDKAGGIIANEIRRKTG